MVEWFGSYQCSNKPMVVAAQGRELLHHSAAIFAPVHTLVHRPTHRTPYPPISLRPHPPNPPPHLIHQHHPGLLHHRPGDGDALLLAPTQLHAALTHLRGVALAVGCISGGRGRGWCVWRGKRGRHVSRHDLSHCQQAPPSTKPNPHPKPNHGPHTPWSGTPQVGRSQTRGRWRRARPPPPARVWPGGRRS